MARTSFRPCLTKALLGLVAANAAACATTASRELDGTRYYWHGAESAGLGCVGHPELGTRLEIQECFTDMRVQLQIEELPLGDAEIVDLAAGTPFSDAARRGRARVWRIRALPRSLVAALGRRVAEVKSIEDSAAGDAATVTAIAVLVDVSQGWTRAVAYAPRGQGALLDDRRLSLAGHATRHVVVGYDLGRIVWADRDRTSIRAIEPDPIGGRAGGR
jgi:hypothetical protein